PELFFDVVSLDTWKNVLSDSQREHLRQFLPSFPEDNTRQQQDDIIQALFRGDNFRFGNPLQTAQKLFRVSRVFALDLFVTYSFFVLDGHLNPEVVKYRQLCLKSQYKRYVSSQQQYFHTLLKQILASRKELLDLARKNGPDLVMKRKATSPRNTPEERERRAQRRYLKILREVKEECGDGTLSSEEEDLTSWLPGSPTNSPGTSVPLRSVPTLSTQDMKTAGALSGLTPYVEFREKTQQWKCLVPPADNEKDLVALFHLWLETKDHIFTTKEEEESPDSSTPIPRVRTDYIVRPSSGDEKRIFQEQERHRYLQPHKAFTFRMHGFESVVGPVKGVFDKETSLNKAREHSLLRSDRPAYVTILSLVRDAAARLPNGEGTRAEICELLKDSQFLAPDVTSAQVNTVVSGALDRLHYEKDPCVKYDIGRKLWIYLHRDRSEEEFERIHQAQAAAAKAKKALQQKPKTPSKILIFSIFTYISTLVNVRAMFMEMDGSLNALEIEKEVRGNLSKKSGNKEFGVKGSSTPEPAQLNFNECSMPPTPGTPSTPTTPALPAMPMSPTSAAVSKILPSSVPESPKSSPSVLLVSPPTMPQLSTLLAPSVTSQVTTVTAPPVRNTTLPSTPSIPQVRIVTASAAIPSAASPAIVTQSLSPIVTHIRMPATTTTSKGITQVVTMPVKTQAAASIPRPAITVTAPGTISVTALTAPTVVTSKPVVSTLSSSTPTILQSITGQNIIKQVAISGQLGVKAQPALPTTNLRIQGKDVLRLPPSSITTDSKGQTILRITPDMMATLAKSQVTAVKLSQELFSAAPPSSSSKGLLHVTSNPSSPSPPIPTAIKVAPEVKTAEHGGPGFRLMPALGVSVADSKMKTTTTAETKPATTIRIVQGLGVVPPKVATTQSITVTAKPVAMASSALVSPVHAASTISLSPVTNTGTKPVGAATATVRQIPVTAAQQVRCFISGLGRNIILTTVPAGTKLIAGNKPVSFLTAQQLQQLQQQGQATQVRIQTVPASHLHAATASTSPATSKTMSTVVVTTNPPSKPAMDPQRPLNS
ncbi:hypothetical protein AB205_0064960, partial [Aquarana catesbeiana]